MKSFAFEILCKIGLLNILSDKIIIYLLHKFRPDNREVIWSNISNERMKNIFFKLKERIFDFYWARDLKGIRFQFWKSLSKDERIALWKKMSYGHKQQIIFISDINEKCELLASMGREERIEFICNLVIVDQSKIWPYLDSIDFLSWWRWDWHGQWYYRELWHKYLNGESRVKLWKRLPWDDRIKLWALIATKPAEKEAIDWSCRLDLWEHLDWNERIDFWKRLNNHNLNMAKDLKEHFSEEQRIALKEKMQDFYETMKKWHRKKYIEL